MTPALRAMVEGMWTEIVALDGILDLEKIARAGLASIRDHAEAKDYDLINNDRFVTMISAILREGEASQRDRP
jgi:hypothetical protein